MRQSSVYLHRESSLHRLHPLTKLYLLFLVLVLSATLPNITFLVAAYVLFILPFAAWGRVLPSLLKGSIAIVLPFAISLAVIQGLFSVGHTVLFHIGRFAFTLEGVVSGETVASRILLAIGGALLFMISTRPDHLMLSLTQRGLPNALAYIVLTSLQIFPRFQDRALVIIDAQQSRGLEMQGNVFKRISHLVPLLGPLILSSILDVEERAMALEARAFSRRGSKTSLTVLEDTVSQRLLRAILLLVSASLLVIRLWLVFK